MKSKTFVSWLLRSAKNSNYISFLFLILFSWSTLAQTKYTLTQVRSDLNSVDKSINITKSKMREFGDISFLPDLYFVLADLYHEKSRLLYEEERLKNPKKNLEDLDLTPSKKVKKLAIETYIRFTENYPKDNFVDKAYFNIATSYRELGQIEEMKDTFAKITREFPKSKFWEESQIRLGDYFFERKKDYDTAIELYQKIVDRGNNPYIPFAKYKMGFCHIQQDRFDKALTMFESILLVDFKSSEDKQLSDEFKMTDIRRDALIALVWPYSETEKQTPERKNAAAYFESLSQDRVSLIQVLNKLGKRLIVKGKNEQAVPVFARLVELSLELDVRLQAINNFYEVYKKSKKPFSVEKIVKPVTLTMAQVRNSSALSVAERKVAEINFEIFIRDFGTALNKQAVDSKSTELMKLSAETYEDYLTLFPKSKFSADIATNLAEVYYKLGDFTRAGYFYEQSYKRKKSPEVLQSAIRAYGDALLGQEKLSRLDLEMARSGYGATGRTFINANPSVAAAKDVQFNIAKIYYDERRFDIAVVEFQKFMAANPTHKNSKLAINLIMDTYNQREDYKGLIKFGQSMLSSKRSPASSDSELKTDIAEIVKQAQFRTIENKVGDPRSRDYAKKLLAMGQKYKGSSLGDLAIYEAYTSFKTKKDPLVYSAGEQLLEKHADSKYAKEVVADLGQIAIQSGDFDRAANYFEKFIQKYPNDSLSRTLTKSSAILRENQGDYKAAYEHHKNLGAPYTKLAEILAKSKKWKQLNELSLSQPTQNIFSTYYTGLSLVRLGERESSRSYFDKVLKFSATTDEEKTMAAHSLYLRAGDALKDFKQLQFGRGDDGEVTKLKGEKLRVLNDVYDKVIAYGNGKWVIGSLYELGQSYREFADFIAQAPVPKGLTPEVVKAYQQAVKSQSDEFRNKANQYFKSCLSNAEKFEVFTLFVKGCRTNGDYIVDEAIDDVNVRKPAGKMTPDVKKIRQSLLDKADQPELIKQLGLIYIRNQDYGMAKLALSRYSEMRPGAEATAYLGVIEMYSNDFEKAKMYFKSAQQQDKTSGLSQMGLAALYKKFGFTKLYAQISQKLPTNRRQYAKLHPWIEEVM
jgi:tetratricopeptide (TPR) repeat protein